MPVLHAATVVTGVAAVPSARSTPSFVEQKRREPVAVTPDEIDGLAERTKSAGAGAAAAIAVTVKKYPLFGVAEAVALANTLSIMFCPARSAIVP